MVAGPSDRLWSVDGRVMLWIKSEETELGGEVRREITSSYKCHFEKEPGTTTNAVFELGDMLLVVRA